MILLTPFLLYGQSLHLDWDGLLNRYLAEKPRSTTGIEGRLGVLAPHAWRLEFRQKAVSIRGLPQGRLIWALAFHEGSDPDGARILTWSSNGKIVGQILQRNASPLRFGYGDGVLFGPARMIDGRLTIAGVRTGMSPFEYGGIEQWSHKGSHWSLAWHTTSEDEIYETPNFIGKGPSIEMTLRSLPTYLSVGHGGSGHPSRLATYQYRKGRYYLSTRRIEEPLWAVDDLVGAVNKPNAVLGRYRTNAETWRKARRILLGEWKPIDESVLGQTTTILLESVREPGSLVHLRLRMIGHRFQITSIWTTHK